MITLKLIDEFINSIENLDKQISMGYIDEKVYQVEKWKGVLFAFGYASPDLFNISQKTAEESDDDTSFEDDDESDEGIGVHSKTKKKEGKVEPKTKGTIYMIKFPKDTRPIKSVSWGITHALALTMTGQMYSWGTSYLGALGVKGEQKIHVPTQIKIIENTYEQSIIQVEWGFNHSMCITYHHKVYSWGAHENGRLGHGDAKDWDEPKLIVGLQDEKILKVSAADKHNACINSKFELFVWGWPKNGKLGFDSNEDIKRPTPVEDLKSHEIIDVSWGPMHTTITTSEGRILAFGHGKHGKLGDGDVEDSYFPTKVVFSDPIGVNIIKAVALQSISLALDADAGKVYSWGYNGKGMLGYKSSSSQRSPKEIPGLWFDISGFNVGDFLERGESKNRMSFPTKVVSVSIGAVNTLILTNAGTLFIYGTDEYGQSTKSKEEKEQTRIEIANKKTIIDVLQLLSNPVTIKIPSHK